MLEYVSGIELNGIGVLGGIPYQFHNNSIPIPPLGNFKLVIICNQPA